MTQVVWAPQAIQDVEAIRAHVARDSAQYADLIVERLVAAVERLQDHPRSGRVVPELGDESIRELIHGNYRIVYRVRHDLVEMPQSFMVLVCFASTDTHDAHDRPPGVSRKDLGSPTAWQQRFVSTKSSAIGTEK